MAALLLTLQQDKLGLGNLRTKEEVFNVAREAIRHSAHPDLPEGEPPSQSKGYTLSLSSLPSSFTTLLLSLLDSPAYANLTTHYLKSVFNPATPNDPSVKYFSVAGRISSMNIWHPLWLPKMVLDDFEEAHRASLSEKHSSLILAGIPDHELWGNDGLVTLQSARWGEFLGTMEECDHWSLRGAGGLESGVELSTSVSDPDDSVPTDSDDAWSLGDWAKFVKAWKREEKKSNAPVPRPAPRPSPQPADSSFFADDVVRASTDKLSAVFDWIVEQVPSRSPPPQQQQQQQQEKMPPAKSDIASKADLERFYVALCRKLYEEGL